MKKEKLVKLEKIIAQEPFEPGMILDIADNIRKKAIENFGSKNYLTRIASDLNEYFRLRLIYPIGTLKDEKTNNVRESFILSIPAIIYLFENKIPSKGESQKILLDESLLIDYFNKSELNKTVMDYLQNTDFKNNNAEFITAKYISPENELVKGLIKRIIPVALQVDVVEYHGTHETRMLDQGYFQKKD